MNSQKAQVESFRGLHAPDQFLVLPNVWDAASAAMTEAAGAKAVATSSAALAWCHGYPDGHGIPVDTLLAAVREIVRVVKVPVSVDSEGGFSDDPAKVAAFVMALVDAGVAGINLEDATDSPELLAAKIGAIKQAAKAKGADIFINARTDVYLANLVGDDAKLAEAIRRGKLYAQAGADGLFVPALNDPAGIEAVVKSTDLPVNILVMRAAPAIAELKAAGVRRVSAGALMSRAAYGASLRATKMLLDEGKYDAIFAVSGECPDFNAMFGA